MDSRILNISSIICILMKNARTILAYYKEFQGLIVDLIQLIFYVVAGTQYIYPFLSSISKQPVLFKILIPTGIILFLITTYKNFVRIINRILFEIEYSALQIKQKESTSKKIYNFNNIVPSTKMLNYLHSTVLQELKKWSKDIIPLYSHLTLDNCHNKDFTYSLTIHYYSPLKKIVVSCPLNGLKIPEGNIIEHCHLSWEEKPTPHILFFKYHNWYKAVITILNQIESEILGKSFRLYISEQVNYVSISIFPEYEIGVSKSFFFFYSNSEIRDRNNSFICKIN